MVRIWFPQAASHTNPGIAADLLIERGGRILLADPAVDAIVNAAQPARAAGRARRGVRQARLHGKAVHS
jgi:hypothetical protein